MTAKWMTVLGVALLAAQAGAGEPQDLKTRKEKMSYTVGVDTGRNLRQLEAEVDLDLLMKGLKDGLSGGKTLVTEKELWETRNVIQHEMRRKRAAQKAAQRMKQLKAPKSSEGGAESGPTRP